MKHCDSVQWSMVESNEQAQSKLKHNLFSLKKLDSLMQRIEASSTEKLDKCIEKALAKVSEEIFKQRRLLQQTVFMHQLRGGAH